MNLPVEWTTNIPKSTVANIFNEDPVLKNLYDNELKMKKKVETIENDRRVKVTSTNDANAANELKMKKLVEMLENKGKGHKCGYLKKYQLRLAKSIDSQNKNSIDLKKYQNRMAKALVSLKKATGSIQVAKKKLLHDNKIVEIDGEYYTHLGYTNTKAIYKMKSRYRKIIKVVEEVKPTTILEIGTCAGKTARAMLTKALEFNKNVHYIGYDLFEDLTTHINQEEYNGKINNSLAEVKTFFDNMRKLYQPDRMTFELHMGDTNEILQDHKVDLVWLDGGHSIKTIRNDFNRVRNSKVVIFDDYYEIENTPNSIDINNYGCNKIVDELNPDDVEIFMQFNGDGLQSTVTTEDDGYVGIAIWKNPDYKEEE